MLIKDSLVNKLLEGDELGFVSILPNSIITAEELEFLLFSAIDEECDKAIRAIVKKGVSLDCKESESQLGLTAIQVAIDNEVISYTEKYLNDYLPMSIDVISLLVDLGFDPLTENLMGVNSVEFAASRNHYEAYNYLLKVYPDLKKSFRPFSRPEKPKKWGL